jgi:hypothetical protein
MFEEGQVIFKTYQWNKQTDIIGAGATSFVYKAIDLVSDVLIYNKI